MLSVCVPGFRRAMLAPVISVGVKPIEWYATRKSMTYGNCARCMVGATLKFLVSEMRGVCYMHTALAGQKNHGCHIILYSYASYVVFICSAKLRVGIHIYHIYINIYIYIRVFRIPFWL